MDNKLLDQVDNYKDFLTVNELDKELLSLVSKKGVLELGKSADGHAILCAKLGKGKKNALIFGFPHPNEPVGSLTCISLIKLILSNKELQKKYTWYIVPCADPDGAKLNEGWFKGKFTIKKYAYNYYRSKSDLQTDWTFPIKYKNHKFNRVAQNTLALKNLIDKIKPDLVYSLHNAGFSGAYFLISKPLGEKYYDEITKLCNSLSIPLDMGGPEVPFMKSLKGPIYNEIYYKDSYDFLEGLGIDTKILDFGENSIGYAKTLNKNVFGLVGEITYIYDNKIKDVSVIDKTRRECILKSLKVEEEVIAILKKIIDCKTINKKHLLYDWLVYKHKRNSSDLAAWKVNLKKKEYDKNATVSQEFENSVIEKFYSSLALGQARRLLLVSGKGKDVQKLIKLVEDKIAKLISFIDKNSDYHVIPIKKLVKIQLGCLFLSLDYL